MGAWSCSTRLLTCTWQGVVRGWESIEEIMGAIARPDFRAADPIAGRERFYRQHLEGDRWLRVVVDFSEDPAWVVTAVVQDNDPRDKPR